MTMNVQHGGWVRASFVISDSESTIWSQGLILEVDTSGEVIVHNNDAVGMIGLALKDRTDLTGYGPTTTSTVGTPSGERAELLLDPAYITDDDQLASGSSFTPSDLVYAANGGKLTNAATLNRVVGVAATAAIANAGDSLDFFWNVQY